MERAKREKYPGRKGGKIYLSIGLEYIAFKYRRELEFFLFLTVQNFYLTLAITICINKAMQSRVNMEISIVSEISVVNSSLILKMI